MSDDKQPTLNITMEKLDELVKCLAEELAESVQFAMKASRHGLGSSHPAYGDKTNRELLSRELGNAQAITQALLALNALAPGEVARGREHKLANLGRYLHAWAPGEWETLAAFVRANTGGRAN
jgi:hypothetical protein